MALSGNDQEKLKELGTYPHKAQGIWFLNAFWDTFAEKEAESVWKFVHKYEELDLDKGKEGCDLDELNAHRFLESFNETLTVREMREKLRSADCLGPNDRPKRVPLVWFLMFKYEVDWHKLVNASQGDNKAEIEEAQRKLEAVQASFEAARQKADEAKQKLAEAERSEEAAKQREKESYEAAEESKQRELDLIAAKKELEAALAEVKKEEEAYEAKKQELQRKSEEGGMVSRNKAKNELAQLLAEDPLPLRKAKITAEAAVKRADRATKQAAEAVVKAEEAAKQASAARAAAEEDRKASEAAAAAAEQAVEEAKARVAEAEAYLEEVKKKPGQAMGALWWIERELHEAKAYMPQAKGGYQKRKI